MRLLEKHLPFREMILSGSPVLVDITSAAHWYFQESPQDYWDLAEDMHSLTPPHSPTYMEFAFPSHMNVNGERKATAFPGVLCGCAVACFRIPEDYRLEAQSSWLLEAHVAHSCGTAQQEKMMKLISDNPGWMQERESGILEGVAPSFILDSLVFMDTPDGALPVFRYAAYLDETGKVYSAGKGTALSPALNPQQTWDFLQFFTPFAFALSLMNCKNVHLVDDQRVLIRNQRRRMERNDQPILTYKWLHIKQLQKKVDTDIEHQKTGRHNRLHFVRAHWATYTADAPLFGKYQGVFFKPSHVKGSLSAGVALKNYTVDAPTNGETKAQ